MKAIFFEQHGELEVLKFADLPDPKPEAGEALIRVKACALNHLDIWVRRGWKGLRLKMPHITGSDIAGEIVSVNVPQYHSSGAHSSGAQWTKGTKVIVNPGVVTAEDEWVRRGEDSVSPGYRLLGEHLPGGLAEYVTVPVANVFKYPEELKAEEACAPLLVATTCWRMLFKRAALRPGESVLVVGSGGGVNSFTIQLARAIGATVYALCGSKEKMDLARELGSHHVINYQKEKQWAVEILKITRGRGVDVVVDNVGQATFPQSLSCVARGGRIVTVGNTSGHDIKFDNRLLFTRQISLIGSTMGSRQDFIDALAFLWNNNIKPVIDRVEPLKNGIKMIQRLEEGKQFGKIVLSV